MVSKRLVLPDMRNAYSYWSYPELFSSLDQALQSAGDGFNEKGVMRGNHDSLGKAPSGLLPEGSGGSFMALLRNVSLHPSTYLDSSDTLDAADASKSGMRIRIKNYFNRQKGDVGAVD